MNFPQRYALERDPEARPDAVVLSGTDTVTGLPVRAFSFEGAPLAAPGDFRSEYLATILWSGTRGNRGGLVAAAPESGRRASGPGTVIDAGHLLSAARGLRDAARAGLVHGDIRPERLVLGDGRLVIEGYGVPWRPQPGPFRAPETRLKGTLPGDVWSLAATLCHLGVAVEDETVAAVLDLCLSPDPEERPSAEELYLALAELLDAPSDEASAAAPEPEPAPAPRAREPLKGAGAPSAPVAAPGRTAPPQAEPEAPPAGVPEATEATPEDLEDEELRIEARRDLRRRLALTGGLMAAIVILALLVLYGRRGGSPPPPEATIYVVEVSVSPADLPPVTIHLISSPPGSSLARARGERLGTAPRYLALDRPGTWAFQGSVGQRRSEIVEIDVPEERSLTLVIPE